jgi:hypothetical protein
MPAHPETQVYTETPASTGAPAPAHPETGVYSERGYADTFTYNEAPAPVYPDRAYADTFTYVEQAPRVPSGAEDTAAPETGATPEPVAAVKRDATVVRAVTPERAATRAPGLVVRTDSTVITLPASSTASIGRDPDADVYLDDERVSWEHAVLRPAGDGWVLEDLGSSNGTFLGGEQVTQVEITADREVRLGDPEGPLLRCQLQTAGGSPRPAAGAGPAVADAEEQQGRPGQQLLRRLGLRRRR